MSCGSARDAGAVVYRSAVMRESTKSKTSLVLSKHPVASQCRVCTRSLDCEDESNTFCSADSVRCWLRELALVSRRKKLCAAACRPCGKQDAWSGDLVKLLLSICLFGFMRILRKIID